MGWPEMEIEIRRLADALNKDQREQRRYEIARDVMAALYSHPTPSFNDYTEPQCAEMSVRAADALLAALAAPKETE